MPASLAPSPLRYPACQPDLEGCAERADVLLSDPSSQIAPLVARARRCRATHHRAFDVRALMWPHAGTSSCWRVVDPGVTAQSPDQGADAQGSRDAVEPWAPLARVWLLVGAAPTRRYISHLSLALPRAWQALACRALHTSERRPSLVHSYPPAVTGPPHHADSRSHRCRTADSSPRAGQRVDGRCRDGGHARFYRAGYIIFCFLVFVSNSRIRATQRGGSVGHKSAWTCGFCFVQHARVL